MDYSELIEAINQNDRSKINELLNELIPQLKRFLQIHMNASREDAEDISQQAIIKVISAIEQDQVYAKESILTYSITTCRNTYLTYLKKHKQEFYNELVERQAQKPQQLAAVLDEERRRILEWCMEQLSSSYKQFIDFWFAYPDTSAKSVATHFDLSLSNAWTRKHRVLKKLNKCYEKKIDR